jgi:L-aminopeptidase/D-esterase-like protein
MNYGVVMYTGIPPRTLAEVARKGERTTVITNDNTNLEPKTSFDNQLLRFDFSGLEIGVAEYEEGPTGCTVFYFPDGASTAIDIRGGSVGTIGNYEWNHAICLAGGSLYGLEAATGVAAELFARRDYSTNFEHIALVSGAIIYDYPPRRNAIYPDKRLGRAAIKAAVAGAFPLGRRGAGCSASVGKGFDFTQGESSGQGGAFRQVGVTKVAAFTVVNALGAIVNQQGEVVKGHVDAKTGRRHHSIDDLERRLAKLERLDPPQGNTTLTVVVTNQKVAAYSLKQLARQVHTSMGRAIQPFQTVFDGDTLYAVTTNEVENPDLPEIALGVVASEVVWDAVLSIVDVK